MTLPEGAFSAGTSARPVEIAVVGRGIAGGAIAFELASCGLYCLPLIGLSWLPQAAPASARWRAHTMIENQPRPVMTWLSPARCAHTV